MKYSVIFKRFKFFSLEGCHIIEKSSLSLGVSKDLCELGDVLLSHLQRLKLAEGSLWPQPRQHSPQPVKALVQ